MTALLLPVTLVLCGALLAAWLLPAAAHVLRRRILLLGMVTLAVLPIARWAVEASGTSYAVHLGLAREPAHVPSSLHATMTWLAVGWAIGTTLFIGRMARRWQGMAALVRASLPLSDENARLLERLMPSLANDSRPFVRHSSDVATACVALDGWRPVILLPTDAFR